MALKDNWKQTGKGLGHAFRDLGKTIVKSARVGVDKASEWAETDETEETGETKKPAADAATDKKPE